MDPIPSFPSEVSFLLEASRAVARAARPSEAFFRLGEAAVCMPGVSGVTLELPGNRGRALAPGRWFGEPDPEGCSIAEAPLFAGEGRWGWVRLYYAPSGLGREAAARVSRFLGEQFALLIECVDLEERVQTLRQKLSEGHEEIRAKKALARASGLLGRRRGIPERAARALIEEQSRYIGKTVADVADAIIAERSRHVETGPGAGGSRFQKIA